MKSFHKITILGILLTILLLSDGCGSKASQVRPEPPVPEIKGPSAEEIAAKISQGVQYFEAGDLDSARSVIKEVLDKSPDHLEAISYWKRINQSAYCTVYSGDTLSEIAQYYYGDSDKWKVLAQVNNISNAKNLKRYQRLRLPLFASYQEGKDELERLKKRFFANSEPSKILMHPIVEGDSIEELSKKYYGQSELSFFLADFNSLENAIIAGPGDSIKIPIFPKDRQKETDQEKKILGKGKAALKQKNYQSAYKYFSSIPKDSPYYKKARRLVSLCKTEGVPYYEKLGDKAFQAGDPKNAGKYWKRGLALSPQQRTLKKKIDEAKDLLKALESIPEIE